MLVVPYPTQIARSTDTRYPLHQPCEHLSRPATYEVGLGQNEQTPDSAARCAKGARKRPTASNTGRTRLRDGNGSRSRLGRCTCDSSHRFRVMIYDDPGRPLVLFSRRFSAELQRGAHGSSPGPLVPRSSKAGGESFSVMNVGFWLGAWRLPHGICNRGAAYHNRRSSGGPLVLISDLLAV